MEGGGEVHCSLLSAVLKDFHTRRRHQLLDLLVHGLAAADLREFEEPEGDGEEEEDEEGRRERGRENVDDEGVERLGDFQVLVTWSGMGERPG